MKILNYVKKNIYIIKLYIIFLDHIGLENYNNYNVNKLISEFFLKLLNNENLTDVINYMNKVINDKNLFLLKNINLKKKIKINKIIYNINQENNKYKISFLLNYNNNKNINIIKILPRFAYLKIKNNKYKVEKYLLLFYIILGYDTGQFWGLHPKFYKFIEGHFKNSLECFASPFNNNLKDYFSILYDIDKYYNSKGNFFKNFLNINYEAYIINPPFIDSIIIKTLQLIEQKIAYNPVQIFLFIPQWDDIILPWFNKIKFKYVNSFCNLKKNKSIVFDYIENKELKASFPTYYIYINSISNKLCNIMKINYNNNL